MCIINGTIKEFNAEKGFGYITNEISDSIFFHYTELIDINRKKIKKGDIVSFKLERKSKEYIAKKVIKKD